jgi:hypothetical protein
MHPKLCFWIVVPAQRFLSKDSANEYDFIVVIVIIILNVSDIAIHSGNPMAVGHILVCWISLKFLEGLDFVFLLEFRVLGYWGGTCDGSKGDMQ